MSQASTSASGRALRISLLWSADVDHGRIQPRIEHAAREARASMPEPGVEIDYWQFQSPDTGERRRIFRRDRDTIPPRMIAHPNSFCMLWVNGDELSPASQSLGNEVSTAGGIVHIFSELTQLPPAVMAIALDWAQQMKSHRQEAGVTTEEKITRALARHCFRLKERESRKEHEWLTKKNLPHT